MLHCSFAAADAQREGKSSAQAKRTFGRWRANKAKYSLQILVDFEHFPDIQLHLYLADAPAEKAILL